MHFKTDPFCVLKEEERFYRDRYKRKNNDPEITQKNCAVVNDLNIPKLSEEQQEQCEGSSSAEECFRLLNSFDLIKTPGNDGIPIEFYKTFWAVHKDSFVKCVNECFEKRCLTLKNKPSLV